MTSALGRSCTSPKVFAHSNLWRLEALEDPGSGLLRRTSPHKRVLRRFSRTTAAATAEYRHRNRRPSTRFGLMFGKLSLEIWGAL